VGYGVSITGFAGDTENPRKKALIGVVSII
jgi:hypothetical protein